MCLTGVDYFSTLGYQPGIAFLAAGALSPVATLVLVLLTLFGALPIYRRVAEESPHGEGSISMLEHLLPRWKGKLFVLVLLGFVATDFIITITLSAADATAHILENPYTPHFLEHRVGVTIALITLLGAVFLKGFKEAIGIAVLLVAAYLLLNLITVGRGLYEMALHPEVLPRWKDALFNGPGVGGNPLMVIAIALLLFPKLALGLSGFETGVAVMPLVKGDAGDEAKRPAGRVRNTKKLLTSAALIMSVMLITSSFVTATLIPPHEFAAPPPGGHAGGKAYGRALAFLAYEFFGNAFGTLYDLSTIAILWFAGASALAGLLNIVPRYLPRYGMAPTWARANRPLVLIYTVVAVVVTVVFDADVEAQGGAYATGVLVLMSSAAIAVSLSARRRGKVWIPFLLISLVFFYTTVQNIHERPEGIKIASFFILAIVAASFMSRIWRTTELRVDRIELDETARRFISELVSKGSQIRIVANRRDTGDASEYRAKEREKRLDNHIPTRDPVLFFEVKPGDASEFSGVLEVQGVDVEGHRVLRAESPAVPNAIAAFMLYLRDTSGKIPHAYFGWSEGNPLQYMVRYVAFGEGDTAPITHEILRQVEPDPERRPAIHVGG
ncbi:MAG: amino acid transporter [Acidobacteria bacterium]|nr:amino acid transporter [Acidobacteriota bacterium]MCA1621516.1 amino acid transporter [Acidobacteriota bacterium]